MENNLVATITARNKQEAIMCLAEVLEYIVNMKDSPDRPVEIKVHGNENGVVYYAI